MGNDTMIYPTPATPPPASVQSFIVGLSIIGSTTPAYLEFQSITPSNIRSDMPMMIAQFLSGACTGVGDPKMMYISSKNQGVNTIHFYRNNVQAITANVLTLIGSNVDVPKLYESIAGVLTLVNWTGSYLHPNPGTGGAKRVYIKHWGAAAPQQVSVIGDSTFTAITYGLGNVESYGYNAGTLIRGYRAPPPPPCLEFAPDSLCPGYVCAGSRFRCPCIISY